MPHMCLGSAIAKFMMKYYNDNNLRAMSYEGIEIKAFRFVKGNRAHVQKVNCPVADGVDIFNVMALQLMPRHFQEDIEAHEQEIFAGIDTCLKHLGIRHLVTNSDIYDLVFDYKFADTAIKLDV
jgi:hypothetical protein